MQRKRGGQPKHWAEEARVLVWYYEIKKRSCNWPDYALNYEFAWTEEGKVFRSPTHRPRTFEWIRKSARKPAGRDRRWHDMNGLVAIVDQHPLFKGTQAQYMSKFWDILQEQTFKPQTVQSHLDELLSINNLVRVNPHQSPELIKLIEKYGREQLFDRCLMLTLENIDRLTGMVLLWLLYLQNEPVHNWPIRVVIESIADQQLDKFFYQYFSLDKHLIYYTNAINTFLHIRLDMSERSLQGYGYLETMGAWPIIPQALLDTISENHLFYRSKL
jgi:hypothetical protein